MSDRFANLEAACGGSITIEALTRFQIAMREYEDFMGGMRQLLAPVGSCHHRDDGRGHCIDCGEFI